jgi:flagellar assembly factor FliW
MPRKKVITEPHIKSRILKKREEDGSLTEIHTLQIKEEFVIHNFEGPAIINKKQRVKEYYLNGIKYPEDVWKEIRKGREGLPWYKNPAMRGARH